MRIFVSEYLCSGAWSEKHLGHSLAHEGKAMLLAVLADFARIPECKVVTTWDRRLGNFPTNDATAMEVANPEEERKLFGKLAAESDATFVIAPEFSGILADRWRMVEQAGSRFLGATLSAIELCSDKLALAEHLARNRIPTIETLSFDLSNQSLDFPYPIVLKPRDGAGSQQMFLIKNRDELTAACRELGKTDGDEQEMIQQPYLVGRTVSIGVLISSESGHAEILLPGEQCLNDDGRFGYLGGHIPASCSPATLEQIEATAAKACAYIDGLNGYIGIDMILREEPTAEPVVVEINPRLTTSYIGYRSLTNENLAERILFSERTSVPILWKKNRCEFDRQGTVLLKSESPLQTDSCIEHEM